MALQTKSWNYMIIFDKYKNYAYFIVCSRVFGAHVDNEIG